MFVEWVHKGTNAICSENIHHSFARLWTPPDHGDLKMAKEIYPWQMLTAYSGGKHVNKNYSLSLNRVLGKQEEGSHSESGSTPEEERPLSRAGRTSSGMRSWDLHAGGICRYLCEWQRAEAAGPAGSGGGVPHPRPHPQRPPSRLPLPAVRVWGRRAARTQWEGREQDSRRSSDLPLRDDDK